MRFRSLVAAVAIAWFSQTQLTASIVTFNFYGSLTGSYDPFGLLIGKLDSVNVDAMIRYDSSVPGHYPDNPNGDVYFDPTGSVQVSIGGLLLTGSTVQLNVSPYAFEAWSVQGQWSEALPSFLVKGIRLRFEKTGQQSPLLPSSALPTSIDFDQANIRTGYITTGTFDVHMYSIYFSLTPGIRPRPPDPKPTPGVVPEPGSAALFGVGMLLCGVGSATRMKVKRWRVKNTTGAEGRVSPRARRLI